MAKKELALTSKILVSLATLEDLFSPFMTARSFKSKMLYGESYDRYRQSIYYLKKKGWIRFVQKKNGKFLELTQNGELEALVKKAKIPVKGPWDGKWRLFIFDIPEDNREKRDILRRLLKINGFYQLQASVYINPYPLNREAVRFLNEKKLTQYIRILRVDEIDNDRDIKKKFNL